MRPHTSRIISFLAIVSTALAFAQDPPDWLPVEDLPTDFVRTVQTAQAQIQTRNHRFQSDALDALERQTDKYGSAVVRTATPLLVEVAAREYRILEFPRSYAVQPGLRIQALKLLGRLGGDAATAQITDSMLRDPDSSVRGIAALTLVQSDVPRTALSSLTTALWAAHAKTSPTEIQRMLRAVEIAAADQWIPIPARLVEVLTGIASGPYSESTRNQASTILLSFLDR